MKLLTVFLALCASVSAVSSDLIDSTTVYIQAVEASPPPATPLAEVKFNPSTLSAELVDYTPPSFSEDTKLLRVGVYDPSTNSWRSSTSSTSAETFAKGYSPTIVISLDAQGDIIGISCKSSRIDAGQTRDFGPKVKVVRTSKGKAPALNRPVVLNPEGKLEEPVPEKTFLQKYWWAILAGVMVLMSAGGGGE